ncbi:HAD family hydrolase [Dongia sp. agr-C8]
MLIFFDVDGVLIDGWHADVARRKPWDAMLEADLGIEREAFQTRFFAAPCRGSASIMFECVTGRRDLREALSQVLPELGFRGSADDFMRYWFEKDSNVNKDVLRLVADIRQRGGARTFIATGQEHHRARYLWETLGFSQYFDAIFYSAKIGHPKKDERFFAAINRELGIEAEQRPLFFDDQPEVVALANSIGWDATTFTSGRNVMEHPRLRDLWS